MTSKGPPRKPVRESANTPPPLVPPKSDPASPGKGIREWGAFVISLTALSISISSYFIGRKAAEEKRRDDAISIVREVDMTLASNTAIQSELRFIGMEPSPLVGEVGDCTLSGDDTLALHKVATRLHDALQKNPHSQPALDRLLFITRTLSEPALLDPLQDAEDIDAAGKIRIHLITAALNFDLQALDEQIAAARALTPQSDGLVVDAAWALTRVGRTDEAIQLLQQQSLHGGLQVAFDLADALSKQTLMNDSRAPEAYDAVRQFKARAPQQQLRAIMLEHDIQFSLGHFEEASQLARRALIDTLGMNPQPIPHRWVDDLINASVLSGDAQLRILDDAIRDCPSNRRQFERSRVGPLIEARRCNDALAAAAAADVTGFLRDLYEVLVTPVADRRGRLRDVESRLQAANLDDKFIPMVIGIAGWSLDDAGKAQRAEWIAAGIENFLPSPAPQDTAAAESWRESMKQAEEEFFDGMEVGAVIGMLRDYVRPATRAKWSAKQKKFIASINALSRSILTENTAAMCDLPKP